MRSLTGISSFFFLSAFAFAAVVVATFLDVALFAGLFFAVVFFATRVFFVEVLTAMCVMRQRLTTAVTLRDNLRYYARADGFAAFTNRETLLFFKRDRRG